MTIFSGAKIGDSEASPTPRNRPVSANASIDTLSLFFAASITSWGFLELARDDSAREQTIASRQPRDPQVHSNPSGSTITWPTSPAHSPVKRSSLPPTTMPPPTPVPMVRPSSHVAQRPPPYRYYPNAHPLESTSGL